MFENFSARRANISILVGAAMFTVGILIFGSEEGEIESSLVLWLSFGAAFGTDFLLYYRDERAAKGRSAEGTRDSSAG